MTKSMPVIFISHGPPTTLLMNCPVTDFLKNLKTQIVQPEFILCISAHWETIEPSVTGETVVPLIYDFGGPPQLFNAKYHVEGCPELSSKVVSLLKQNGFKALVNDRRCLDHGAWVPLKLMYPDANIPVVQLSIQTDKDANYHYNLGKALQPLREQGTLILGSGGAVHNLYEISNYKIDDDPPDYVKDFDMWLQKSVLEGDVNQIVNYTNFAPQPEENHPYPAEHFLPLPVCLGAAGCQTKATLIHKGFMYGTLSMAAFRWD